mmetsp:Transcript_75455/g.117962  ORF Transcript_75455/g.117962 Transcript_75455/m.117962 type:complete len:257 (+) Transcript_75455:796-1566(+)
MLDCKASMSASKDAIASFVSAMVASKSEIDFSKLFLLSSAVSSSFPQYSFLLSSSVCSVLRVITISSIILITLSKPIFLPWMASAMKSRWWRSNFAELCTLRINANAFARRVVELTFTCMKLELGKVFLNNSKASSSLRIFIVSARAKSSSFRVLTITSHSSALVLQFFSRSARNFLSSRRAAPVSPKSFFISTISTANSPARCIFSSMAFVNAFTSFVLAEMSSSYAFIAASSAAFSSAKSASISSCIVLRIPTI